MASKLYAICIRTCPSYALSKFLKTSIKNDEPKSTATPEPFESTPEGRRINKLDQIFLNGNHVTMLVPGGDGPDMH